MKRREFITLLGGAAAAWPMAARGQHAGRLPTIGFLGAYTPSIQSKWTAAFLARLHELGWDEGSNVAIEYRWAEGREEHFTEFASEFARLKVDVIVTGGTAPIIAAKQATSTIPIVFATAADPVGTGLVASLARPGGWLSLSTSTTSPWSRCHIQHFNDRTKSSCRSSGGPAKPLWCEGLRAGALLPRIGPLGRSVLPMAKCNSCGIGPRSMNCWEQCRGSSS